MENTRPRTATAAKIIGIIAVVIGALAGAATLLILFLENTVIALVVISAIISITAIILGIVSRKSGGKLGWILGICGLIPPTIGIIVFGYVFGGLRGPIGGATAQTIELSLQSKLPGDTITVNYSNGIDSGESCSAYISLQKMTVANITKAVSAYESSASGTALSNCDVNISPTDGSNDSRDLTITSTDVIKQAGSAFWEQMAELLISTESASMGVFDANDNFGEHTGPWLSILTVDSVDSLATAVTKWNSLKQNVDVIMKSTPYFKSATLTVQGCPAESDDTYCIGTRAKLTALSADSSIVNGVVSKLATIDSTTKASGINVVTSAIIVIKNDSPIDVSFVAKDPALRNTPCNQVKGLETNGVGKKFADSAKAILDASSGGYSLNVTGTCDQKIFSTSRK